MNPVYSTGQPTSSISMPSTTAPSQGVFPGSGMAGATVPNTNGIYFFTFILVICVIVIFILIGILFGGKADNGTVNTLEDRVDTLFVPPKNVSTVREISEPGNQNIDKENNIIVLRITDLNTYTYTLPDSFVVGQSMIIYNQSSSNQVIALPGTISSNRVFPVTLVPAEVLAFNAITEISILV